MTRSTEECFKRDSECDLIKLDVIGRSTGDTGKSIIAVAGKIKRLALSGSHSSLVEVTEAETGKEWG